LLAATGSKLVRRIAIELLAALFAYRHRRVVRFVSLDSPGYWIFTDALIEHPPANFASGILRGRLRLSPLVFSASCNAGQLVLN